MTERPDPQAPATRSARNTDPAPRRTPIIAFLLGIAAAMWIAPVSLLSLDAQNEMFDRVFQLVVGISSCAFVSAVLIAVTYRVQNSRTRADLRRSDERETRDHEARQLAAIAAQHRHDQMLDALDELKQEVRAGFEHGHREIREIRNQLKRGAWDIYADALVDKQGGPEIVNGQTTAPINPVASVVQMRGHNHRRN